MLNLGMNMQRLAVKGGLQFTPASLFNNGEAGVWYDPSAASGSLGWRKNLFEYTESFDNSYWVKSGVTVTANVTEAPDGENTAYKMAATVAQAEHRVRVYNIVGSETNTISIYAKRGEYNYLGFRIEINNVWSQAVFDLHLGVLGVATNTFGARTIEDVGNGWYRCSATFTSTTANQLQIHVQPTNSLTPVYTGDGSSGIYIWGAQIEEASTASSYQPILSTFANSFKAAFPSHTLYQDSQGVTPVTAVGEPVGLMLDKSKGLAQGPELVINGDFATDSDWTKGANWTIANGSANSNGTGLIYQTSVSYVDGKTYKVTFDANITSGEGTVRLGNTTSTTAFTNGANEFYLQTDASNTTRYIFFQGNSLVGSIDNVSVTEIQGSHATQPTSTKRPIYARHPEGGIRNLLNYTEQFDNGYWSRAQVTVTANATIAPDGTNTADKVEEQNTNNTFHFVSSALALNAGVKTFSAYFKADERSFAGLTLRVNGGNDRLAVLFNLTNGTVSDTITMGSPTQTSSSIQDVGNGWYRCSVSAYHSTGNVIFLISPHNDGTSSSINMDYAGIVGHGVYAWGAQLEEAAEASNYQKVVTDIDVTESGVNEVYYLKFDGIDDGMAINNLTSPSTPITALFGYSATNAESLTFRYLIDIEVGRTLCVASATPAGYIGYFDGAFSSFNAGNANALKVISYDLVEDNAKIRIDGTQEYSDTTYDQKAISNTVTLFVDIYDNNFLGGNMYQTILRAAESTDEEIAKAETYVANKTGLKAQVDGIATLDLNFGANLYTAKNSNGGVI